MKRIFDWLFKNWKLLLLCAAIIVLIVAFFSVKSCINRPIKAAYQAGIADGKADVVENQVKPLADKYKSTLAENATLKKTIAGVNAENDRLKGIITGNVIIATSLEEARKSLTDKDAIIANLDQQVLVHKQNEAVWEDRYNNEHGLRLKLQVDYDDLFAKYGELYKHDQAAVDALKEMTRDRDLYRKASRGNLISPWIDKVLFAAAGYGAGRLFGK